MEDEPFCYTEENKKEHCGIRNCEYLFGIYIAVVASIIVTVISLLFFFCYCRKRNKIARNLQNVSKLRIVLNGVGFDVFALSEGFTVR